MGGCVEGLGTRDQDGAHIPLAGTWPRGSAQARQGCWEMSSLTRSLVPSSSPMDHLSWGNNKGGYGWVVRIKGK